jgi:hypothetical protein
MWHCAVMQLVKSVGRIRCQRVHGPSMTLRYYGRPTMLPDYTASHPTEQRYHRENLTSYKICAEYQECIKSPIILASDIAEQLLWFRKDKEEFPEKETENKMRLNTGGGSIWGKVAQYIRGREDRETENRNRKSIGRKRRKRATMKRQNLRQRRKEQRPPEYPQQKQITSSSS